MDSSIILLIGLVVGTTFSWWLFERSKGAPYIPPVIIPPVFPPPQPPDLPIPLPLSLHFTPNVRMMAPMAMSMAMIIVDEVYAEFNEDAWITSGNDGVHKLGSYHYLDAALDFRINTIPVEKKPLIVTRLQARLAPQFRVLWEDQGTPNEHVHVEYVPQVPVAVVGSATGQL